MAHPRDGIPLGRKRNELLIHTVPSLNLEGIMLNERKQSQRLHIIHFHLYDFLKKERKTIVIGNSAGAARGYMKGGLQL